jgi:hypothetical protein
MPMDVYDQLIQALIDRSVYEHPSTEIAVLQTPIRHRRLDIAPDVAVTLMSCGFFSVLRAFCFDELTQESMP